MDSSRKQFKALSMAQPIKKQINETLLKLQTQKRKFLSSQRQQASLKEQLLRARRQLNEIKLLQPKTRVKQNKNIQTSMSINNTDRLYLSTINKISQLRTKVDVHRKQIQKYKRLVKGVNQDIQLIREQNDDIESELLKQQEKNQAIKDHLMDYRTLNMRNTDEFKSSFNALNRSTVKQENQRKKSQALRKSFNFEELKYSHIIKLADVEEQHSSIHQQQQSQHDIYMTNCIPLVKNRIRTLIQNNKERIKISENYRKFGEELENMFHIMKEYKGRDDSAFIADQFVMKEKQLKKIQQYIGKLENRLMFYKSELQKIKHSDKQLINQLNEDENQQAKVLDKTYINLQNEVKQSIQQLKQKEHESSVWFEKIGQILAPLAENEIINRSNVDKILGMIEEKFLTEEQKSISQAKDDKLSNKSPSKAIIQPTIDQRDLKSIQSMQLLSYQKLREYAKDYISIKK